MKDGPMDALERSTPAEVYEQYLGRSIADPFARMLLDHAAPKQGERVLDLASGTGSVARQVAPMVGRQGRVVAVDINPAMLAVGRAMSPPAGAAIEWLEGNAVDLDLPDAAFDLVLCQQGLQFFPDRVGAAREMRRVLMPEGRVAISVWQTLARHPVYEALFKATASHLGARMSAVDVSFSFGDPEQLRAVLRNGGFDRIDIVPRSLDISLQSPALFVQLTVRGAATSVPAFARLDPRAQAALVKAVSGEMEPIIGRYRRGDELTFPMHTNIAIAS
jgi:ubiquinone/menaquinone biosynthesis C-methylase UbiE